MSVPKDKHNLIYILFFMHGIGIFMPWLAMIEVFEYFKKREDFILGIDWNFWELALGISSLGPRIIFMVINLFLPKSCGSLSDRILFSLGFQSLIMAFIVLFTMSSIEKTPQLFLWLTIVSNCFTNIAGGVYASSAFGSAAVMPMKCTNAVGLGFSLASIVVILFNIIFKMIGTPFKVVAFIYFSSSIAIQIVCILMEITQKSNKFRDFYDNQTYNDYEDIEGNRYFYVFTQISEQLLDLFLILFVSFTIYPGIFLWVVLSDKVVTNWVSRDFEVFFSFIVYEIFNFIGTITANLFHYPTPKTMIAFSSTRLLFIPIFLFFNYQPKGINQRELPVLFKSDLLYCTSIAILGLTNGHFWSLALMYAPKQVSSKLAHIAGMMSSIMIGIPVLFGFYFSSVLENIV